MIPSVGGTGDSFSKEFLRVNLTVDGPYNKPSYFYSDKVHEEYTGVPLAWESINVVVGYREVYRRNQNHVLVKITEMFPLCGRQHYNFYNVNNWSGWKTITPV